MESLISAIVKVAPEIAKAARTARRNSSRCLELAERARNVGDLLHDSQVDKDTPTRTRVLVSLSEALGDALRLVESCRRGCLFWRLLAASRDAGRFGNVDRRITNCLLELGIANDARREKQFIQITANTRAGSEMGINVRNAKKKDVAKNDNKSSSTTTAAARKTKNKRRRAGRKGKQAKQKAAGPPPPPPPPPYGGDYYPPQHYFVHSVEEDPNSCSVM